MREYNRDDFWGDDGVMFARLLSVITRTGVHVDTWARIVERMGVSPEEVSSLFERAVVATQNHEAACDEANAAYRSDPANVYGTDEHEALLMEEERGY